MNTGSTVRYETRRVLRHWHWARTQGVRRLVEEDDLDLAARAQRAFVKARWRRSHGVTPGMAVPVFLLGVQRSGTNMIVRGLETAPEFEVRNENDRSAFERFRLRSLDDVRAIVERSRHLFVLFKPLCDSQRADELLERLGTAQPGRVLWAYRGFEARAASALAKFGDANLQALRLVAAGRGNGLWQAEGISPENRALLRSFDWDSVSPATAAALFWYVRNSLFFELGLDQRPDVALVSYEAVLADPEARMRELCGFLGVPYRRDFVAHIAPRVLPRRPLIDIDPKVEGLCTGLERRLADAGTSGSFGQVSRPSEAVGRQ